MSKFVYLLWFMYAHLNVKVLSTNVQNTLLNDGNEIPMVGFGTWQIVLDRGQAQIQLQFNIDKTIVTDTVLNAIEIGYRLIDTAYIYNNEIAIGQALKIALDSGAVARKDLFIVTKIWNTYHTREKAVENLKMSLKELGLDYADLTLMHFPMGFKPGFMFAPLFLNLTVRPDTWERDTYVNTWKGLEDAKKAGLTKSIGVSNFNIRQMKVLLEKAEIKPTVNQVECHPVYNQNKLLEYLNENKIKLMAYSPLRQATNGLLNQPLLTQLSKKYNKTVAQISLRWNIQRGVIVIPKTVHKSYMNENLQIFDFNLNEKDMELISNINQMPKNFLFGFTANHPDYSFNEP